MKKNIFNKSVLTSIIAGTLVISQLLLSGCSSDVQADDLMKEITPQKIESLDDIQTENEIATDFAVRLMQHSLEEGKNTLISPLSVMYALAMTANGAKGETGTQMETVLGMKTDELNNYLYSYMQALPNSENYKLSVANSIWFKDHPSFTVKEDFLQLNANYYGADIYKAPFDKSTAKTINDWVNEKTDKMIPKILDEIPDSVVMYLVNALAFESEWLSIYKENEVSKGNFTLENGTTQSVEFMHSEENWYLEDEKAIGVLKYYKDMKYAFVALLPKDGVTVSEYVASLNGKHLHEMLENVENATVHTKLPKFETEYEMEMSAVLSNMGMPLAFKGNEADFSGLGNSTEGNIYISRVLHKTFISVAEKGTKAGAATAVEMNTESAIQIIDPKKVFLDKPFVYMIMDCENHVPIFIGTLMNVK